MAEIVLGLGTSHAPSLSLPLEKWPLRAEAYRQNTSGFVGANGETLSYEELEALADSSIADKATPEFWRRSYEACQQAIDTMSQALAGGSVDILLIIGDDQKELFQEDNMPALCIYWGDTVVNVPRWSYENGTELHKAAAWGYGWGPGAASRAYPGAPEAAKHLITSLIDEGFDVGQSRFFREGEGIGHAFAFVYERILRERVIPVIPIFLNTYYPPNQPLPQRCYQLGRALRSAIEVWDSDVRVGVVASGGLSHSVVDEELDRELIRAMNEKDSDALCGLPPASLNAGSSEIRNWLAVAGATEHLQMDLVAYEPCYFTPGGTGCGMAFALWS